MGITICRRLLCIGASSFTGMRFRGGILIGSVWLSVTCAMAAAPPFRPLPLPVAEPRPITAEADPVTHAAVSGDGSQVVYTATREAFPDLWIRAADPAGAEPPRKLTDDSADETDPAFSPDARRIAYAGTADDAKGDIFILDLKAAGPPPVRLTDRTTWDGGPCFSADGRTLYFHRREPGGIYRLASLDLSAPASPAADMQTGGDAMYPAVSPDGRLLAFESRRRDANGDIFILDLASGGVRPLTAGAAADRHPRWSPDGKHLYFSRIPWDTNRDGEITGADTAAVYRIAVQPAGGRAFPVTSGRFNAFRPAIGGDGLFFLSDKGGSVNYWAMPRSGPISERETAGDQFDLATAISGILPADPLRSALAFWAVLERFPAAADLCAKAAYEIGTLYLGEMMEDAADAAFGMAGGGEDAGPPEAVMGRIQQTVIRTRRRVRSGANPVVQKGELNRGIEAIRRLSEGREPEVRARAALESARLILAVDRNADGFARALALTGNVIAEAAAQRRTLAEARVLEGEIYQHMGNPEGVAPIFLSVVRQFADIDLWAGRAMDRLLQLALSDMAGASMEDKIRRLRQVAAENAGSLPMLAAGALNRVGDLLYTAGDWNRAKTAYTEAYGRGNRSGFQAAAARMALAEILYKEERFRQALDLYETEMSARPYEDPIYRLARIGYIHKSIAAGEQLFRYGEIAAARKKFSELIAYDATIVPAHRGYIRCAAAAGEIGPVTEAYREQRSAGPGNPVALYAEALCLTYLEDRTSLEQARHLLERTIQISGRSEYFYQTLGYVLEVLETVHGQQGLLESALTAYQKAFYLNDPKADPSNSSHLTLNIGNIYYLLGRHRKAFTYYDRRMNAGVPFDNPDAEIVFYRRLGASAFQIRETGDAIRAFNRALEQIETRMTPTAASDALVRIHRYTMDRTVAPALKIPGLEPGARSLSQRQAAIYRQLSRLTETAQPPPDSAWQAYRDGMAALLDAQQRLLPDTVALSGRLEAPGMQPEPVRSRLTEMARAARLALNFPERLVALKTELLDRLALAYQDDGAWEKAAATFERAFLLNRQAGSHRNLVRNLRSKAYNLYMLAGNREGTDRRRLLQQADADFARCIELVDRFGVPEPEKKPSGALLNLSLELSADALDTSGAARGFTADQERRLVQVFRYRIALELGDIGTADTAIRSQLTPYAETGSIRTADRYGVSLLYHRAGLVAAARGRIDAAVEDFERSARLCLDMDTPVSAVINVVHMAGLLTRTDPDTPESIRNLTRMERLDQRLSDLLASAPPATGTPLVAEYHNTMGIFWIESASRITGGTAETGDGTTWAAAARRMRLLQKGGVHLNRGIRLIGENDGSTDRRSLTLLASLHLNAADLSSMLNEPKQTEAHLARALDAADRGLANDMKWRALARSGRLETALETAEAVTVLGAGCSPGEIVSAFAPLVAAATQREGPAAGFNLAERISELERFNRTAFAVRNVLQENIRFWLELYPRLDRLTTLRNQLAEAGAEASDHLKKRIDQERGLLLARIGPEGENLPDLIRSVREPVLQETVLALAAVAASAEAAVDSARTRALLARYRQIRQAAVDTRPEERAADILTLFGPEPWEDMGVMESLGDGGTLLRIFPAGPPGGDWIAFTVSPERISAERAASVEQAVSARGSDREGPVYLSIEHPDGITGTGLPLTVLNGSHLVRSHMNRKPFKRRLLALPEPASSPAAYSVLTGYDESAPTDSGALSGAQTLVLADRVSMLPTVPTRENQRVSADLIRVSATGRHRPLVPMMAGLSGLSVALLPRATLADGYLIGHLFSIFGCPSVLIPETPGDTGGFVGSFLEAYADKSVTDAWIRASRSAPDAGWRVLGYGGMNRAEAEAFASRHFAGYTETGVSAYKNRRFGDALAGFRNAVQTAEQAEAFRQHLPALYRLAREAAFSTGLVDEASGFAAKLAEVLDRESPDSDAHADALWRLGLIEARQQRFEPAAEHLTAAVEMLGNLNLPATQADALDSLGIVMEDAAAYEKALSHFRAAESLSRTQNRTEWTARQHENIGRILDLRMSRYARAVAHYGRALDGYRKAGRPEKAAQSLLDMGRCYRLMGNFAEADRHYDLAAEQAAQLPETEGLHGSLTMERANNAWFQARYEEAFRLQRRALAAAETHHLPLLKVNALNTSGLIWWTLGDNTRALSELERALEAARGLANRRDEIATSLNNMGLVYRETGRYADALRIFDEALAIDTAIGSRWAIAYDLRNKGLTYLRMDRPEQAVPLLEEAARQAGAIGNRINEAKAVLGLADAHAAAGSVSKAETAYREALEMAGGMGLRETLWRAYYGLGRLRLPDDRQGAETYLRQAVAVIESMRADIRIDRLKDSFIDSKLAVYEALVSLLADRGEIRASFEMAERSRARNFIDLLGNQRLTLNRTADQARYDRYRTLRARISEYETLAAQAVETAETETYRGSLERLRRELDDLMLEMQADNPQLAALVSVAPVELERLTAIISPDVGLLTYYVLPREVFCWVVRHDGIRLFRSPVGRDSLNLEIRDYRRAIQNLEPVDAASQRFHGLLISPVLETLADVRYLGIVPHGPLHYLSYATLSDADGYLIDRFALFNLPSASVLDYTLKRRRKEKKNVEVLAIGNPDLGNPALDLPFAEHEVNAMRWNFPRITTLTRDKASEDWVVDNIGKFGIIHLASHGDFNPINPLFSAIKLAKGKHRDGNLEAAEVFELNINADLVVLSACQTGLGRITGGDDVIGMNRSFFYAGTHAVISSLWRVSDTSTAVLIKQFYRQYLSVNKADSLRLAMQHVRQSYAHPGYWGAFTLVGDYE